MSSFFSSWATHTMAINLEMDGDLQAGLHTAQCAGGANCAALALAITQPDGII